MGVSNTVPLSHWYTSVVHFFKHIGISVSNTFVLLFGIDAAHTFAIGAESLLKSDLGKIAMTAVQEASLMASGAEKKAAAFAKITAEAKTRGLDVENSLVNMLIELAVARFKGLFGN